MDCFSEARVLTQRTMGVVRALRDTSQAGAAGLEGKAPPIPSTATLVLSALSGNAWAHEALFRRHVRMARGLAYRLLVGSGVDVDDLVQDAFVTAYCRLDSLREPEAFSSWLGSIVVRTASKRLRRQRLRLRFGLVRTESVDLDLCVASSAPPDAALLLREIYGILDQLRPDERIAFLLRRVEGLTVSEVAERMNTSLSTAKRRLLAAEGRFDRAVTRRPLIEAAGSLSETVPHLLEENDRRPRHD